MPVRTGDWLKFGPLVAIAFVFGLASASTLKRPKKSGAAETLVVPPLSSQPAPAAPEFSAPALKSAGDFQDAFVAVAEHVKPSVVFIRSQHVERADDNQRLPPGFQDFFPNLRRRPQVEQGSGSGFIVSADGRSEEHTSELQSQSNLVCRLLLEKKKNPKYSSSFRSR